MRVLQTAEDVARIAAEREAAIAALPAGDLSARWVQSRACFQVYKGGWYVAGACGMTEGEALERFAEMYSTEPQA